MKKKLMATALLSVVFLAQLGQVAVISANDTDSQIAAQDNKINEIAAQQASTQEQVDALQEKVDSIIAEQASLNEENVRLEAESTALIAQIEKLSADIVSRSAALENQARSAQTDASATSYINTILDSKSIVDAVSRVNAMREIVSANNRMLEQQKADKEAIAEKQKINQEAINTVIANKQKLDDAAHELRTQESALKAAQLSLAAEKATAEDQKAALLEQKAAAEEAARQAAAQQAAYQAQQAALAQQQEQPAPVPAPAPTPAPSDNGSETPAPAPTPTPIVQNDPGTQSGGSYGNYPVPSYPPGECTWGVQKTVGWVGSYWGNGGQWAASAAAAGFRVGSEPQVGAVAVWSGANGYGGGYGHVAVVTAVESSTSIRVLESNYGGNRFVGDFRGWFNPVADGVTAYIYPN